MVFDYAPLWGYLILTKEPYGNWMLRGDLLEMEYTIFAVVISFMYTTSTRANAARKRDQGEGERVS